MTVKSLVPASYKLHMAKQFYESLQEPANTMYYVFAGKSTPFAANVVETPYDSVNDVQFDAWNSMLFGKNVTIADLSYMVKNIQWTSNTVYDMYDDQDINLANKNFYTAVTDGDTTYVYKCLFNNDGAPSTSQPTFSDTAADDSIYQTDDNYQWKYLYSIDSATYSKFATADYIPFVEDTNVTGNAVAGAIDVILVESAGAGYNNYYEGSFNAGSVTNSDTPLVLLDEYASKTNGLYDGCVLYITGGTGAGQYKNVISHAFNGVDTYVYLDSKFDTVPDNTSTYEINPQVMFVSSTNDITSASARALVNSVGNTISCVDVLDRGHSSLHAEAYVYASPQASVSNVAELRVITSPKGGHGSNVLSELFCTAVGVSVTFANSESNTIPTTNDYHRVGLIKDPLFANVEITTSNATGEFTVGEIVSQNTGVTGFVSAIAPNTVFVTNVAGTFSQDLNITGATSNVSAYVDSYKNNGLTKGFSTFVQMYRCDGSYTIGVSFEEDEKVYQYDIAQTNADFYANAVFHSDNGDGNTAANTLYLTEKKGPIYGSNTIYNGSNTAYFHINTIVPPDLVEESGDVLYIENFDAINRANTQSETVKLVLEF